MGKSIEKDVRGFINMGFGWVNPDAIQCIQTDIDGNLTVTFMDGNSRTVKKFDGMQYLVAILDPKLGKFGEPADFANGGEFIYYVGDTGRMTIVRREAIYYVVHVQSARKEISIRFCFKNNDTVDHLLSAKLQREFYDELY